MNTEDKIIDALTRKNYKGAILGTVLMFSKSILERKEREVCEHFEERGVT